MGERRFYIEDDTATILYSSIDAAVKAFALDFLEDLELFPHKVLIREYTPGVDVDNARHYIRILNNAGRWEYARCPDTAELF